MNYTRGAAALQARAAAPGAYPADWAPSLGCRVRDRRLTDVERAKAFYGELFGWTFQPMADYHPDYWLIDAGDGRGTIGALWPTDVEPADAGSVVYVAVTDLAETIGRAQRLGGGLVREPTDVGDGTSFALIHDLNGVLLGLWARHRVAS